MANYKDKGFVEPVPKPDNKKDHESYYIPHHVVIKSSSTSTTHRVVYDASMKTSTGASMNNALLTGPKLQIDLQPLHTRFRSHQVAISADIEKFYLQTHVHLEDRDFQRFFWREMPHQPLQTLRMTRVTFGLTCAPFLAIRALHHLAQSHSPKFPIAAQVITEDFLVDNLLSGRQNPEEALLLQTQLTQILGSGNMKLLKWASNTPEVTNAVPPEARDKSKSLKIGEGEENQFKTIGVNWHPQTDRFSLCMADSDAPNITTKRSVLSFIARTFDPLGWISPVTVRAKTLMQKLWAHPLDWDEPIPLEYHRIWRSYRDDLALLHQFTLDRNICKPPHSTSKNCRYQLHGFCDGRDVAYAACAYVRTQDHQGRVRVQLVSSKTKVNPVNGQTTPRSELCGALLLSHLMDSITKAPPNVQFQSTHLWTDSTVVLGRVNPEIKLPIFELNRVSKILSLFPQQHWNHVKGEENPADCASRGISAKELLTHPLWLHGPAWLTEIDPPESVVTLHATQHSTTQPVIEFINSCSFLFRMKRVIAHWLWYMANLKSAQNNEKRSGSMSVQDLDAALMTIVKIVQQDSFQPLSSCLWPRVAQEAVAATTQPQTKENRVLRQLKHLAPFLDEEGVIRVGGRLRNAVVPYEKKRQALLPKSHNFVDVLARHFYVTNLHAGLNLLLSLLREKYWIVRGPDLTKKIVRSCVVCLHHSAIFSTQLMAHLPPSMVNAAPTFSKVGVDYAGPFQLMLRTGRKPPMTKAYVSLFVCMATKAIHLELVHDLTTEAFLAALIRFISRRGRPDQIFCDGGTNFVGAKRELQEIQALLQDPTHQQKMTQASTQQGITFQVNPPASPHHGGLWEALVKSMKYHLRRVMGDRHLTVSEFSTLLTQVEAILNSRPLTPLSSDPNDLSALTPGHFLIGRPLVAIPQLDTTTTKKGRLDRWQRVQQVGQHFWQRWSQEYLTLLNSRPKWLAPTPNYEVGMIVLLRAEDNALATQKWKIGRIAAIHPGSDGMVRVCDIRTNVSSSNPAGTVLRRPVVKISPLPFYD